MNFEEVCRTCLGSKSLKPIFKDIEYYDRFSQAMLNTTGLKVELNDGLPQNICIDCVAHINKSLKFRVQCKDSETKLLHMLGKIKISNAFDVDRNGDNGLDDLKIDVHYIYRDKKDSSVYEENASDSNKNDENAIDAIKIDVHYIFDENKDNVFVKSENETDIKIEIDEFGDSEKDKLLKALLKNKNDTDKYKNDTISKVDTIPEEVSNVDAGNQDGNEKNDIYSSESDSERDEETESNLKKQSQRVSCKICRKDLSINSIYVHMSKLHPGADEKKDKCELCETYVYRKSMNRHLDKIHGKLCSRCGICKLELPSKDALMQHVVLCKQKIIKRNPSSGETGKEIGECEICHKKMQKAGLKIHHRIEHEGLAPTCDHCGRKFRNKSRLEEHLRSKHGFVKFKCSRPKCDFQSASSVAMQNHERRHRGEKPYVCERCGAAFHARYLLTQHLKSHRTERLVKCEICAASFKTNNGLHMHKMSCHSRATYKCPVCTRAYKCRHYAVKHLRTVHRYTGPVPPLHQNIISNDKTHSVQDSNDDNLQIASLRRQESTYRA